MVGKIKSESWIRGHGGSGTCLIKHRKPKTLILEVSVANKLSAPLCGYEGRRLESSSHCLHSGHI